MCIQIVTKLGLQQIFHKFKIFKNKNCLKERRTFKWPYFPLTS